MNDWCIERLRPPARQIAGLTSATIGPVFWAGKASGATVDAASVRPGALVATAVTVAVLAASGGLGAQAAEAGRLSGLRPLTQRTNQPPRLKQAYLPTFTLMQDHWRSKR